MSHAILLLDCQHTPDMMHCAIYASSDWANYVPACIGSILLCQTVGFCQYLLCNNPLHSLLTLPSSHENYTTDKVYPIHQPISYLLDNTLYISLHFQSCLCTKKYQYICALYMWSWKPYHFLPVLLHFDCLVTTQFFNVYLASL